MAETNEPRFTVSRRRVVVGAAWAAPAVLIATGSPPAAASTHTPPDWQLEGSGETYNTDTIYGYIHLTNTEPTDGTGQTVNGPVTILVEFPGGALAPAPPGASFDQPVDGWSVSQSSETVTFTYDYDIAPGEGSGTVNYEIPLTAADLTGTITMTATAYDDDGNPVYAYYTFNLEDI
ncbi:hypothetical protein [Demequina mangrovi]|uniref:Uncharacterized protein n=1 Tax=Demequina mangrovi TaxID=1043493 RepID=A0A1H6YTD9_9MICO|nr:hypothetical protein [Demequina mangrovi]SEJ39985.1 hypothetical protein SAMN05421637_1716 [Demequina mangrovi]